MNGKKCFQGVVEETLRADPVTSFSCIDKGVWEANVSQVSCFPAVMTVRAINGMVTISLESGLYVPAERVAEANALSMFKNRLYVVAGWLALPSEGGSLTFEATFDGHQASSWTQNAIIGAQVSLKKSAGDYMRVLSGESAYSVYSDECEDR
ncbi:Uncharacterised protein [Slackia heliotrinireducens]|uniref:Uncharacterized protein n=1 Tax=Slackia heliotrinireducens (strain ATCC 29202 / DSM 20476 / NCTC 11029 / RHS 1) TaxID=471855 RepID=C7N292_SLAHD|nr:hypothetical protein [Slackia heliotrinireducens]ACV21398.1 hypothetical protein Shel_03310 [Slackia heliotrinireducens DSM 20476]VEG98831.1 Uncharacterised protein [Slackia heliotrinireducens]